MKVKIHVPAPVQKVGAGAVQLVAPRHVTWPTAKNTRKRTVGVLTVCVVAAVVIAAIDALTSVVLHIPLIF